MNNEKIVVKMEDLFSKTLNRNQKETFNDYEKRVLGKSLKELLTTKVEKEKMPLLNEDLKAIDRDFNKKYRNNDKLSELMGLELIGSFKELILIEVEEENIPFLNEDFKPIEKEVNKKYKIYDRLSGVIMILLLFLPSITTAGLIMADTIVFKWSEYTLLTLIGLTLMCEIYVINLMIKWMSSLFHKHEVPELKAYDNGRYDISLGTYLYKKYMKKNDERFNELLLEKISQKCNLKVKLYMINQGSEKIEWNKGKENNLMREIISLIKLKMMSEK